MLRYHDHTEVRVGDRVLHSDDAATVEVLIGDDKTADWGVSAAGFMIVCERCGRVFIEPGSADWEDVSLQSRG